MNQSVIMVAIGGEGEALQPWLALGGSTLSDDGGG